MKVYEGSHIYLLCCWSDVNMLFPMLINFDLKYEIILLGMA